MAVPGKDMALADTIGQPLGRKQIDFPFLLQGGVLFTAVEGEYTLLKIQDFYLARIMIGAQYGIRVRALPFPVPEIVSQMYQSSVRRLFQYLQIQIHAVLYARQQTSLDRGQSRRQHGHVPVIFLAQIQQSPNGRRRIQQAFQTPRVNDGAPFNRTKILPVP